VGVPRAVNAQANHKSSRSLHRGVRLEACDGKWQSRIKTKGKELYLGAFGTEELAARAYDRAAICIHNHYNATTNFPVTDYKDEWEKLESMKPEDIMSLLRREALLAGPKPTGNTQRWAETVKASNFRGVRLEVGGTTWAARMQVNGRKIHLGSYSTEVSAARAYDRASICIHGFQGAVTNLDRKLYQAEAAYLEEIPFETLVTILREEGKSMPRQNMEMQGQAHVPRVHPNMPTRAQDPMRMGDPSVSPMTAGQPFAGMLPPEYAGHFQMQSMAQGGHGNYAQFIPFNPLLAGRMSGPSTGMTLPPGFYGGSWQPTPYILPPQGQPAPQAMPEQHARWGGQYVPHPPMPSTQLSLSPGSTPATRPQEEHKAAETNKRSLELELFNEKGNKVTKKAEENKKAAEALLVMSHNQKK